MDSDSGNEKMWSILYESWKIMFRNWKRKFIPHSSRIEIEKKSLLQTESIFFSKYYVILKASSAPWSPQHSHRRGGGRRFSGDATFGERVRVPPAIHRLRLRRPPVQQGGGGLHGGLQKDAAIKASEKILAVGVSIV
jgi:hypothetical protein